MIISRGYIRIQFLGEFQINFPTFSHWDFFYFFLELISHLIELFDIFFCEHARILGFLSLFLLPWKFGLFLLLFLLLYSFFFLLLFFFDGFECLFSFFVPFLFFMLDFTSCFIDISKHFIKCLFFLSFLFAFQDIPLFLLKSHDLSGGHPIVLDF